MKRPRNETVTLALSPQRESLTRQLAEVALPDGFDVFGLRGLAARLETSDRMLLYYFESKDRLMAETLAEVSRHLAQLLQAQSLGPRLSVAQFLMQVLALAADAEGAPFMRLWSDVIARAARGEQPFVRSAPDIVRDWTGWIESRLLPMPDDVVPDGAAREDGRAAALLAIVEGIVLLEMASPGSTVAAHGYLAAVLGRA